MNGLIKKATQRKIMYLGLILLGVLLLLFVAPVPQAYAFDGNPTSQFSPSLEDPSGGSDLSDSGNEANPSGDGSGVVLAGDGGVDQSGDDSEVVLSDDGSEADPLGDENVVDQSSGGSEAELSGNGNDSGQNNNGVDNQSGDGEGISDGDGSGNDESTENNQASEESEQGGLEDAPSADESNKEVGLQGAGDVFCTIEISGWFYDSITRKAIDNVSIDVSIWHGETDITDRAEEQFSYNENGKYRFYFLDYLDLPLVDGEYTVKAEVPNGEYESYAWTFDLVFDILDQALAHLTYNLDFYLAPKKVKNQEGQTVDSGVSGSWASYENKVVIDRDLIYPGYDLKIVSVEEEILDDIINNVFEEITIQDGIAISTRKLAEGNQDYLNGISTGDSGNIFIQAERINIGEGVKILAHAINDQGSFKAGNITVNSYAVGGTDLVDAIPGVDIDHPRAIIEIGNGAIIKGKAVSFTATANSEEIFHPDETNPDALTDTANWPWLTGILNTTLGMGLGIIEDLSLVGGVSVVQATSLISIKDDSSIEAETFEALSSSYIKATASPIAIAVGVAVGVGISDAQVIVDGKIVTIGDCTLRSLADNTIDVVGSSGGIAGLSAGVAVSVLKSNSKVHVGVSSGESVLQVGGNLTVEARTVDRNRTFAVSTTDENGKVGIAVAVSYEHGVTEAILAGTVDVEKDLLVGAYMNEEGIDTKKMFIFPSVDDGVSAFAGANISSTGDILDDVKSAIIGKITGFVKTYVKEFIKEYILEKKQEIEEKSGSTVTPFELAAAIAVYVDTNEVSARISPNADVKTRGSASVLAKAESQPYLIATGSVKKAEGSQNPGGGGNSGNTGATSDPTPNPGTGGGSGENPGAEEGTKFAGAAAIAVGIFTNDVNSFIGANAKVNAAKDLNVKAEYLNDYEFRYGIELITLL